MAFRLSSAVRREELYMYGELSFTYFSVKWNSLEVIEIFAHRSSFSPPEFQNIRHWRGVGGRGRIVPAAMQNWFVKGGVIAAPYFPLFRVLPVQVFFHQPIDIALDLWRHDNKLAQDWVRFLGQKDLGIFAAYPFQFSLELGPFRHVREAVA